MQLALSSHKVLIRVMSLERMGCIQIAGTILNRRKIDDDRKADKLQKLEG